jgi:acetyl esterase/lipase
MLPLAVTIIEAYSRAMRLPLVLALLAASWPALAATPPAQPKQGPGGADYPAEAVTKRGVGSIGAPTYVFHAAGPASAPRPVVVFLHAWGATNPLVYGGWLEHLARKGFLVLYPRFQEINRTRPADATGLAAGMLKDAFAALADDPDAKPDPSRVVFVGHLAGAAVAANLAALAGAEGLPKPKLVLAMMPGGIASDAKSRGIPLADLSQIDPGTLFVTVIGDREHLPSDRLAKRLHREATGVPQNRKLFVRAPSDDHGFPTLAATLTAPGGVKDAYDAALIKAPPAPPGDPKARPPAFRWSADMALTGDQTRLNAQLQAATADTLDYLAFWKTLDMAAEAAFAGGTAEALRDMPDFVDMGRWSDGWPVRRLGAELPRLDAPAPQAAPAQAPPGPRRRL